MPSATAVHRGHSIIPTTTMILPTGMPSDDHDAGLFAVYVRWQSTRGWTVTGAWTDERLSAKGRQWCWGVASRNRRFYYFPTYGEAVEAAISVVDERVVNGRTWAQWSQLEGGRG